MFLNYTNLVDPRLKSVRLKVLEFSQAQKNSFVLDVCCGTGDQAFYFAQISENVFGIDLDQGMLKLAKQKMQKQQNAVCFKIANATNLPFEDNYFDIITISLALHEKEEEVRIKVIEEMKRVVKPNGRIIVADYKTPLPKNLIGWSIRIVEFLAGKNHFTCFKDYLKKQGVRDLLLKKGLKIEKQEELNSGTIEILKLKQ